MNECLVHSEHAYPKRLLNVFCVLEALFALMADILLLLVRHELRWTAFAGPD